MILFKNGAKISRKLADIASPRRDSAAISRRGVAELANVHYLRHERFFIMLATHGRHPFYDDEAKNIRDDRWRVRVQIGRESYRDLKADFLDMAAHRTIEQLGRAFYCLPYEPYARVRQQLLDILRLVNRARKSARLQPVSPTVLLYRCKIVRPFDD